ncbi:AlpA family phage regulatory protein [Proteus vulgaris]|uniref:helix-turn-helix transcriptional regulator n=1 Tax=Proteus vulgaris TaxID=585 RepID=UPI0020000288|nr:AlpA family phage regulatory protein [Proteus vulgaris]UPK81456.1 AlpA family phage regulatory protein [Proteus vulgaris]
MNTQPTSLLDGELIDMKFITQFTKLTDKWFYALIQKGEFPEPIKLGRSSRWYKCEVEKWLEKKIRESRK